MTSTPGPELGLELGDPAAAARAWPGGHQVPVNRLPPPRLMAELAEARRHLAAVTGAAQDESRR